MGTRTLKRMALGGLLLAGALWGGAVEAARPPRLDAVVEGRTTEDHRPLVRLEGKGLKKAASARLLTTEGGDAGALELLRATNRFAVYLLPEGLEPGTYDLELTAKKGDAWTWRVSLRAGGLLSGSVGDAALDGALRADLDDAESLDGDPAAHYVDAGSLDTGTLPPARYSSLADLLHEEHITEEGRFVPGLLSALEDLEDEGFVVDGLLGTDWFSAWGDLEAEGVVDGGGLLTPGAYSVWKDLEAEGHLGGSGLLRGEEFGGWEDLILEGYVDGFEKLKPAYFTAYGSLNVKARIGSGSTQVAAGDHDHASGYLATTGGSVSGRVVRTGGDAGSPFLAYDINHGDVEVVRADFEGTGVLGYGLWMTAENSSGTDYAVWPVDAGSHALGGKGTLGVSASTQGTGVGLFQESTSTDIGGSMLQANTDPGAEGAVEVMGVNEAGGVGMHLECTKAGELPLYVGLLSVGSGNLSASSLALFQAGTSNVARIDMDGKGYFNGGTATSGADFAESVRASAVVRFPEPGDVVVIDREATRGFALCRSRMSRLVAGVVSTKPGILAAPWNVSSEDTPADEIPLAIAGIVPVKVSDENGPIAAGDELVAASLPGYAMKAPDDAPMGTVVGKALGAHGEGLGSVEVLLTLR